MKANTEYGLEGSFKVDFFDRAGKLIDSTDYFSNFITLDRNRLAGGFYSTLTQTTTGTTQAMTFTDQDISLGCDLVNGSQIRVSYTGFYNVQFSAQINKTQGGTAEDIYIWFRVNGADIPNSNTKLTLANKIGRAHV